MTLHIPTPTMLNIDSRHFASRAAMLAAEIPADIHRIGHYSGVIPLAAIMTVNFVRNTDGLTNVAAVTADGADWVPDGDPTPDHKVQNVSPGVTDMSPGFQYVLDYGTEAIALNPVAGRSPAIRCVMSGSTYYMASRVNFTSVYERVHFEGNGALVISNMAGAMFRGGDDSVFDSADCVGSSTTYYAKFENIAFASTRNAGTGNIAVELGKCWDTLFTKCVFTDFDIAVDLVSCGRPVFDKCIWKTRNRTIVDTTAWVRVRGSYDSSQSVNPSAGVKFTSCDGSGVPTQPDRQLAGILIHCADTVYLEGTHLSFCRSHIVIEPRGSADNYRDNEMTDLLSGGGNYFDDSGTGPNVAIRGNIAYDSGTGNNRALGRIGRIEFLSSDKFRGAARASNGINVNLTDSSLVPGDFLANRGPIDLRIAGLFSQHTGTHVVLLGDMNSRVPCHAQITDLKSWDSNTASAGGTLILVSQCDYVTVDNVQVIGAPRNAPTNLMTFGAPEDTKVRVARITDCDFAQSTHTGAPFVYTNARNFRLIESGNIFPGTSGFRRIERSFGAESVGAYPQVPFVYAIPALRKSAVVTVNVVGTSNGDAGSAGKIAMRKGAFVFSKSAAGVVTLEATVTDSHTNLSDSLVPDIVPLTGTTWVASMSVAVGDVVVNSAGNVYYVYTSDGTAGATEPTNTTPPGQFLDGVGYAYIGAEATGSVALVLIGERVDSTEMNWAGTVEVIQSG